MIHTADQLPAFYSDELANVQADVSFFANGEYRSDGYALGYSSGLAVTWPSAIGWNLMHNMLGSRISCTLFSWAICLLLGFIFFRRWGFTRLDSVAISTALWAFLTTPPFAFPYWFGFMYNLGELNSAALVGLGLLIIDKRPNWTVFIFATTVWLGKLIYFPFVAAIILGSVLARDSSVIDKLKLLLRYAVIFLLPLGLWVAWLYLRFGSAMPGQWVADQMSLFSSLKVVKNSSFVATGSLFEHFTSPHWEWMGYSLGNKLKNIIFSLGAVAATIFTLASVNSWKQKIAAKAIWITSLLSLCILLHAIHHFFIHPHMWQRHFQPSLYIGFGLLVYWSIVWIKQSKVNVKPIFCMLAILLVTTQVFQVYKHWPSFNEPSYARTCTNLHSSVCDPEAYQ